MAGCDGCSRSHARPFSGPAVPRLGLLGFFFAVVLVVGGCGADEDRLFARLEAERTGVDFVNRIVPDDTLMNPLDFFYVYNGGGVAAGDVNGDGRTDLYFAGNTAGNRLYLNQGDFRFRDVTEAAGVEASEVWSTGVTLVDINQDGRTDIYVSVGGPSQKSAGRANRLYVNQGVGADSIPTFEERAEAYGIADTGYSTHAAFFDYDRDGDLDLYVLNTAMTRHPRPSAQPRWLPPSVDNQDRLYRNDGDGTYTEVTEGAGIEGTGFGLGLAISDVNGDGWPDVYTANDLYTRDRLYLNQGDGTFTDRSKKYLRHQSYHSKGVDISDVNGDGWTDILVMDKRPENLPQRRLLDNQGTHRDSMWQYGWNTLQLSHGRGAKGLAPYGDVGHLANIDATGWSWAPLLADYDNDGDRDLFVTTGYGALVTHREFMERRRQAGLSATNEKNRGSLLKAMKDLPKGEHPNRFFEQEYSADVENPRGLQFAERKLWAPSRPGISNGAAFADLDEDGDLDLVTNNINEEATILKNLASERDSTNALRVRLHGPDGNRTGLGTRLILSNDGTKQYHDHSIYRGYQSTVEDIVHFGLGADSTADSLRVVWPDGTTQLRTQIEAGQVLRIQYDSTGDESRGDVKRNGGPDSSFDLESEEGTTVFRQVAPDERGLGHRHRNFPVPDFRTNPLLPHRYSQNSPGIAVGDVDGNGLDDIFVGADPKRARVLYRQVEPGQFRRQPLRMGQIREDMGALFFDANGDGHQDLYVVSGGNVFHPGNPQNSYQDRLYLNDGSGQLRREKGALPDITASGSVVTAADYDEDGDLDLFVGGWRQARKYPLPPRSYVLRNDSEGNGVQFTDVTSEIAPNLVKPGLVTDALWTDFNGDGRVDLLVVGEWMQIRFFRNEGGRFMEVTGETGLPNTSGWWNSLTAGDFDRDGDTDYVAGNLGLNTRYEASSSEPLRIYAKDFDQDKAIESVLTQPIQGTEYPLHERDEMLNAFRGMLPKIPSHRAYAEASFKDLFSEEEREGAYEKEAVRFETTYIENHGDGTFEIRELPLPVQVAPVFGMKARDYTGDGVLDLLMVGNWYAPDTETGRADAFIGALLRGRRNGHFAPTPYSESGFLVPGDAKGLAEVVTGDTTSLIVATQNDDSLRTFVPRSGDGRYVPLRPLDRYAVLLFEDGSIRKEEFYHGSTYLSQSSRQLWVPSSVKRVEIHGRNGARILGDGGQTK